MRKYIITTLIVTALSSLVLGQNSRMGSASSTQLLVVPSARYLSGGGAAATVTGMDAVFWNPAGLAMSENNIDAIFSNRTYIAEIDNSFFGVSTSLGENKFGLSIRTFNMGDIKETTVFYPDGTGQMFTPNFSVIGGSISRKLSENTSVGINANIIRESFGTVSATGTAFDLGVQYKGLFGRENLDLGFVLKNFGQPVEYEGTGLGVFATSTDADRPEEYYLTDAAAFDLPFMFDMAISYDVAGATVGATYTSNYYSTDEIKLSAAYGLAGLATVRAGFQSSGKAQDAADVKEDWYTNPSDGVSFGASIDLSRFVGSNLSVDYSMLPMGDFGNNNIFSLRVGF